jgi:hypothetical protein
MGVPNGPADIARFGLSHTTDVSVSANTEVNSIIFTPAATSPYTTANPGFTLTISGAGDRTDRKALVPSTKLEDFHSCNVFEFASGIDYPSLNSDAEDRR